MPPGGVGGFGSEAPAARLAPLAPSAGQTANWQLHQSWPAAETTATWERGSEREMEGKTEVVRGKVKVKVTP